MRQDYTAPAMGQGMQMRREDKRRGETLSRNAERTAVTTHRSTISLTCVRHTLTLMDTATPTTMAQPRLIHNKNVQPL
eukprot:399818-Rhodomonas_salina.2